MLTKVSNEPAVPLGDGLTWVAVLSSPTPDCVKDRLYDWQWSGDTIPLLVGHEVARLPVGTVKPSKRGGKLVGMITFPAPGTSAAADEARGLVEAKVSDRVSISFRGVGVPNDLGGMDYGQVFVYEASLVGVGCCDECRVTGQKCGKVPQREVAVYVTGEPHYTVDPAMIVAVMREAVRGSIRKELCEAAGRLDSTDEDVAIVLANMKRYRGADAAGVMRRALSMPAEEPTPRGLAPSLESGLEESRRQAQAMHASKQLAADVRANQDALAARLGV